MSVKEKEPPKCLEWIHQERIKVNGDRYCPICGEKLEKKQKSI